MKIIIIGTALTVVGVFVWQGFALHQFAHRPAGGNEDQKMVSVLPGESFSVLAAKLKRLSIITHPSKFKWWAVIRGVDKKLKAGEYPLSAAMTPNEVLEVLVTGQSYLYRFTIPEGYTLRQIAEVVAANELGQSEAFISLATSPEYVSTLEIEARTLEGYLFPDTYYFPKSVSEDTLSAKW